jgi:hypothetical protein
LISLQHQKRRNDEDGQFSQLLERALEKGFPNPDRTGCPDAEFLKRVVRHQVPIPELDPWIDHLGSCSECFGEFNRLKPRSGAHWRLVLLYAAAACIVLAGAGILREYLGQGPKMSSPAAGVSAPSPAVIANDRVLGADTASTAADREPFKVMFDLTPSATRGEARRNKSPVIRVPARLLACRMTLPFASSDGLYYVQIQRTGQSEILKTAQGIATIHDGDTRLNVNLDLSNMAAGRYLLSYRHSGESWHTAPMVITNLTN